MAAGLEDIVEANHVGLDIGIRVLDAVADASLGSEVHNDIEGILSEESIDGGLVGYIALDEGPGVSRRQNRRALGKWGNRRALGKWGNRRALGKWGNRRALGKWGNGRALGLRGNRRAL